MKENIEANQRKDRPLVSIVTPSYNCGDYIENIIINVNNQDYPNIEHIVIDGDSNDNTIYILKKHDDKLRWISEPDSGMYDAINKGFKKAKGDILTYINTDDLYNSSNVVSLVVDEFISNNKTDFLYGHCSFIDSSGKLMYTYKAPKFCREYSIAFPRGTFAQPTCFWRREAHVEFDSNLQYVADAKFFRHLCESYNGKRLNTIIARFTIREDCISFENIEEMRKEDELIYADKDVHSPHIKFILMDIFYRMIFLNCLTNIKRMLLKFLGKPYL